MKRFLILLCFFLFFGSQWVTFTEDAPYMPNIRDNYILEKAEKTVQLLAEEGKKEHLVQIIWNVKTQLGILADAKSQYILFALWRIAEEYLPEAISVAAEKNNLPPKENNKETTTSWTIEELPPTEDEGVTSWNTPPDPSPSTTYFEEWKASYYADSLEWNNTANGDTFTNSTLTAAHKTLPFNTRVKVINKKNNHRVVVRINDRGPFTPGRVIDLTQAAFKAINNDSLSAGILEVTIEIAE
jgi:rare lipoprotein A